MNYFSSCQDGIISRFICYKIKIHSFYEINFYIFYLKYAIAPTIDILETLGSSAVSHQGTCVEDYMLCKKLEPSLVEQLTFVRKGTTFLQYVHY